MAALGVALMGYSYWGMESDAGRRRYDEMAGMIPFFVGVAGVALLGLAALLALVHLWRGRRIRRPGR